MRSDTTLEETVTDPPDRSALTTPRSVAGETTEKKVFRPRIVVSDQGPWARIVVYVRTR